MGETSAKIFEKMLRREATTEEYIEAVKREVREQREEYEGRESKSYPSRGTTDEPR